MRIRPETTLRHIGEKLQKDGDATVRQPLPWRFIDLLCQLDEREETMRSNAADRTPDHMTTRSPPANRSMSHEQGRTCESHSRGRA
jgi:hypothetical protein